jgi:dynein heavy chain
MEVPQDSIHQLWIGQQGIGSVEEYFHPDIILKEIPVSEDLQLTQFLVDQSTIGEWNLEGLPSDELSVQNGIMVTRSSRYPLMIDP